jgi:RND family efflux transporter MFP subunit
MAVIWTILRVLLTTMLLVATIVIGWRLWNFYTLSPWTRDAFIQAKVIDLAPQVSGQISELDVADNQAVRKGEVLFVINQDQFKVAVQRAGALVAMKRQALQLAQDNAQRNLDLSRSGYVSQEAMQGTSADAQESLADLQVAEASLAAANIDLARTVIRSPVNGYVTNLTTGVGDYANSGKGVMALVDSDSFYVEAYFVETKLPAIHSGASATVRLMAGNTVLTGTVEGISRAIANRDNTSGLLATVNPNFEWIRLAQRIPVRITLKNVPPDVPLVAGLSCTVIVEGQKSGSAPYWSNLLEVSHH